MDRLADEGAFRGRVLDAGCGTGENALALAARGLDVWGVDEAQTAIEQARAKAGSRRLEATFVVADVLGLGVLGRAFPTVLDCGLFHTFDDDDRARYVESLAAVVPTAGTLHLLCFSDAVPGNGGPRHVSDAEIRESFRDGWRVVGIEPERYVTRMDDEGRPAWLATVERT